MTNTISKIKMIDKGAIFMIFSALFASLSGAVAKVPSLES